MIRPTRRRLLGLLVTATALTAAAQAPPVYFHAETADGRVVRTQGADLPFNPASVTKVGTTLWALDRLGAEHRFTTTFGYRGWWRPERQTVEGSLVVVGGDDPDFQPENAFMVARELNRLGVRRVTGSLQVKGPFWLGWEGGLAKRPGSRPARLELAADRLHRVLDTSRWTPQNRTEWSEYAARAGLDPADPPSVRIEGGVTVVPTGRMVPLVRHRSGPLAAILKRMNAYSNNDIQRIAETLGGPEALEGYLRSELAAPPPALDLSSASGELVNRMTARVAVQMLRLFRATVLEQGLQPGDLLPVSGCDPGTIQRGFPKLSGPAFAGALVAKTGTLTTTDGGVVVLAGFLQVAGGEELLFAIGIPGTGWDDAKWRQVQEAWLLDLARELGGPQQRTCGALAGYPEDRAGADAVVPLSVREALDYNPPPGGADATRRGAADLAGAGVDRGRDAARADDRLLGAGVRAVPARAR